MGDHQTCGIRGRTIQTNKHVTRSVLDCSNGEDRVAMLQVNLENLFNRVRHDGLFKELMHVGLNVIVEGVKMAHQSCSTGLITSRKLTTSIPVESFVRQGCLLSRPSCMRCTCSPIVCVLRAARFFVGLNWIRWSETVSLRGWRDWFLHRSPKLRRLNY